jgi:ABC-type Zn2+ transport system substrate-binding protein/surface adhesin
MFRMIFSLILSSIVVFGFASKELKTSELMNHVNEEHVTHSHDHGHSHSHNHDHEKTQDQKSDAEDHSHLYDISALNPVWNFKPLKFESLKIIFAVSELQAISMEQNLLLKNVPLSIFRPPII